MTLTNTRILEAYEALHETKTRKIALCGFASSTIRQDWPEDTEIWTINCAWRYGFTRITRLFEMHKIRQLTSYLGRETEWENEHWDWLQKITEFPVYMIEHDDRIPASVAYPLDEVCDDIFRNLRRGEAMQRYMTSSASFLMALAIHERVDEIYLSGFEMATGSEYTYQRDGMTYLIGVANGRGIPVYLAETSKIMRAKIYGYEAGQTVDRSEVLEHIEVYRQQKDAAAQVYNEAVKNNDPVKASPLFRTLFRADGALQSLDHLASLSDGDFFGRQTLEAHLRNYEQQHSEAMGFFNKFNGFLEQAQKAVAKVASKANLKRLKAEQERAEKSFRTMLLCEGAIQATQNLISVCDLQEPDLTIREVTRFVEDK